MHPTVNHTGPHTLGVNHKNFTLTYCGDYSLTQIWEDSGFNHCFLDTVTTSIIAFIVIIFGTIQTVFYCNYSSPVPVKFRTQTRWYLVQQVLMLILLLEAVIYIIVHDTVMFPQHLFGFEIYHGCASVVVWLFGMYLINIERTRMVPRQALKGHGLVLLALWTLSFVSETLAFVSWNSPNWWWAIDTIDKKISFGMWCARYVSIMILFILGLKAPAIPRPSSFQPLHEDEEAPAEGHSEGSTWSNTFKKLRMMMPYVWPKGSIFLQIIVVLSILMLVAGRIINVYVPLYNKKIVDSLTPVQFFSTATVSAGLMLFRWDLILIWTALKFLQGGGTGTTGFLNNIRTLLWIKVQQYTTRMIQIRLYTHLHGLSLRWHLTKKTGAVLRIVDRGTTSINSLLSYVLFQIIPTVADIVIAVVYFITTYDYVFGIIVFLCMLFYLFFTFAITEWRTKFRRQMNLRDNETNSRAVDSLLNFETVKYYGASEYEISRYREAIVDFQKSELLSSASLSLLNIIQSTVVNLGLLTGSLLSAYAVVHSFNGMVLTVGDFVQFGTYLLQLYGPLNFLGTYYRMIQQAFIDMENMFDLLDQNQEVQDIPDAVDLKVTRGAIEFKHVDFYYQPEKQILRDISFSVPPGQTYALVGDSGGGKSTIIRLLFRFYDIQSGSIKIDGQDISLVKQESLRKAIGVVPQDTVLFNNNIRYNVRYGRVGASDDEVIEATRAADIHGRILSFPSGYDTSVGERGLKLSGGEKQRVAIARTLLKSPVIVLLDEATSALDTNTERNIQASLQKVCENRTTIIVAHRLSTIVNSDCILVMRDGQIIERGSHEQLLSLNGLYTDLWIKQTTSDAEHSDINTDMEISDKLTSTES